MQPSAISVGSIQEGEIIEQLIKIKNPYKDVLKIVVAYTGCKCRLPQLIQNGIVLPGYEADIPPGEEVQALFKLNTGGWEGQFRIFYAVQATLPHAPERTFDLVFDGHIRKAFYATPSTVDFGVIEPHSTITRQVLIQSDVIDLKSHIHDIRSTDPHIKIHKNNVSKTKMICELTYTSDNSKGDLFAGVEFNLMDMPLAKFTVPIVGRKSGGFRVIPSQVTIRRNRGEKARIRIIGAKKQKFQILHIQPPVGITISPQLPSENLRAYHDLIIVANTDAATLDQDIVCVLATETQEKFELKVRCNLRD